MNECVKEQEKKQEELQSYKEIFDNGNKQSNDDMNMTAEEYERDFM